jgi:hypothetical protein
VVFLVVGEILKLVLVERLFDVSRDKLIHSRVRLDLLETQRGKRLNYLDEGMARSAALEPCRPTRHPQLCAEIKGSAESASYNISISLSWPSRTDPKQSSQCRVDIAPCDYLDSV